MSFQDLLNEESKILDEQQKGEGVKYPKTKHDRLFFGKNSPQHFVQVLPAADLHSKFAVPTRKIFLSTRSSQGKEINANFTLDASPNPGSLLEQKITEWADRQMIPSGYGGQQAPRVVYLLNVVKVGQDNAGNWFQERDEQGNLVVRVLELPQSGYRNLVNKLKDPLLNQSKTDLSFLDINKASPIRISKPAKNQKEYPVEVYSTISLPPLGQGWESQLEDLYAQATPTEMLENGASWVQAFIDMKEGRKPNGGGNATPQQPQVNPFAQQPQANQFAPQQPQVNQFAQQPQANQFVPQQPQTNQFAQQPQVNPFGQPPQAEPFAQQQQPAPQVPNTPVMNTPQLPPTGGYAAQPNIEMPTGMNQAPLQTPPVAQPEQPAAPQDGLITDALPEDFGISAPQPQAAPMPPQQPNVPAPENQDRPAAGTLNTQGLPDIDAMLDNELGS